MDNSIIRRAFPGLSCSNSRPPLRSALAACLFWAALGHLCGNAIAQSSAGGHDHTAPAVQANETGAKPSQQQEAPEPDPAGIATVFSQPESGRWWISGQMNFVGQAHGTLPARYSGPNSFRNTAEAALSNVLTLYTGYRFTSTSEVLFDLESAGGHGISEALGIAGFTNLDVVRSPDLGQTPYLGRLMIHQIFPLSSDMIEAERGPYSLFARLPARRLELRFGKFSMPDFFDVNAYGSDSHLQFLNWANDNNGAYDYAANTRGYTWGALAEYDDRRWALRYGAALMPRVANGPSLDADFTRAHGDNWELEIHHKLAPAGDTVVRLLTYLNHADMGNYREAITRYREGLTETPEIVLTRQQGRIKYGLGLNLEQPITSWMGAFARLGWNDGKTESFAYTEIDRTVQIGTGLHGQRWHRRLDRAGAALVVNGLSGDHREYLRLGGLGFILGDGHLNYGPEQVFETYYTAHLWRGFFGSVDLQHISNPGYNRDRGPVLVPTVRLHIDF